MKGLKELGVLAPNSVKEFLTDKNMELIDTCEDYLIDNYLLYNKQTNIYYLFLRKL